MISSVKKSSAETMNAKLLCELDDLATMVVIDSHLGFQTHKMDIRFKPVKKFKDKWNKSLIKFSKTRNYDECFNELITENEWFKNYFSTKAQSNFEAFKSHTCKFLHFFNPDSGITIKECTRYSGEKKEA